MKKIKYVILEDDICYDWDDYGVWGAVLYDIEANKIFTTKYGHGSSMKEESEALKLEEAVKEGRADLHTIKNALLDSLPFACYMKDAIQSYLACCSLENPAGFPVNVIRGRLFRGKGFLVYAKREPVRYGLGAYRNEYHYIPQVIDMEGNLHKINSFGYIEYEGGLLDGFRKKVFENVPDTAKEIYRLAHIHAYNMSYSHCDYENYQCALAELARRGLENLRVPEFILERANIILQEQEAERQRKIDAEFQERLPSIRKWVEENTDKKTEEEIMELSRHIFNKYNTNSRRY